MIDDAGVLGSKDLNKNFLVKMVISNPNYF